MNKVIIEPSLLSELGNLDSRVEFCDTSGRTLGFFVPASEQQRLLYVWARGEFSDEEIEHARREPEGFKPADILADLEAR
jgi:hypothetical protein